MRYLIYTIVTSSFILGGYGFYKYFSVGHTSLNLNSAVPWGIWVSLYIWFVGISIGGYVIAMLMNLLKKNEKTSFNIFCVVFCVSTFIPGMISILIDLGHIERFYELIVSPNFGSVMGLMGFFYNFFLFFLFVLVLLEILKKQPPRFFLILSIVISFLALFFESLLFARPQENTGIAYYSRFISY